MAKLPGETWNDARGLRQTLKKSCSDRRGRLNDAPLTGEELLGVTIATRRWFDLPPLGCG
jgi:hypothetical protein